MSGDKAIRTINGIAALSMAVATALGAMGAHALKATFTPDQLDSWKTAVLYQVIHSLAMLITGLMPLDGTSRKRIQLVFLIGIVCFSGSIYLLTTLGWAWLGPVTPVGGLCFIGAWVYLAFLLFRRN